MACNSITLSGIALDCSNVGGLKKVYMAPLASVTGVTVSTGNTVTAILMSDTDKFVSYAFKRGNANFVSTGTKDIKAGTYFVENVLTLQVNKQETAKRNEIMNLIDSNPMVIVQDNNDIYWLLTGIDFGGDANGTAQSGAEMAEGNFYTITVTAQQKVLPYEVEASALTTII